VTRRVRESRLPVAVWPVLLNLCLPRGDPKRQATTRRITRHAFHHHRRHPWAFMSHSSGDSTYAIWPLVHDSAGDDTFRPGPTPLDAGLLPEQTGRMKDFCRGS